MQYNIDFKISCLLQESSLLQGCLLLLFHYVKRPYASETRSLVCVMVYRPPFTNQAVGCCTQEERKDDETTVSKFPYPTLTGCYSRAGKTFRIKDYSRNTVSYLKSQRLNVCVLHICM